MEIEQYNTVCFKTANVPNFSEMEIEQNNYHLTNDRKLRNLFGLINKYFLTIFYFIAPANRGQEFLALFYIFKWSLFAKCIVLY